MRAIIGMGVVALIALEAVPSSGFVENPWTTRRPLNIAHQGGEIEAPSDTMYAFKTALAKGADMLEMDVHATADGEIVVLHDATVDRTTNGSGRVDAMTLEEIQQLDAAHWFVPDVGTTHDAEASAYTLRGMATGDVAPPAGFTSSDFTIPTLREVLETFPDTLINIEIKNSAPDTTPYELTLADLLAEFDRAGDVIVVSFLDHAVELFKVFAPAVSTATATVETALFWATTQDALPGAPNPRYHALQVPIVFEGVTVVTEDFVADAHANGFAVHVWTINTRGDGVLAGHRRRRDHDRCADVAGGDPRRARGVDRAPRSGGPPAVAHARAGSSVARAAAIHSSGRMMIAAPAKDSTA